MAVDRKKTEQHTEKRPRDRIKKQKGTTMRATELFDFLNSEKMPTASEAEHRYTHLEITDELKEFRKEWRKEHKAQND